MSNRVAKVTEFLKQELSKLIKNELSEDHGIVCIADVILSGDFKEAQVFISCLDKASESKVIDDLEKHKLEFQRYLGKNLRMKFTPRLEFVIDQDQDTVAKIDRILKEL